MKKLSNTEAELKKGVGYKKKRAANFRGIFQTWPNIYDGAYLQK